MRLWRRNFAAVVVRRYRSNIAYADAHTMSHTLDERLVSLKKIVEEEEKGQNRSTEKFELLWDLEGFVQTLPKETVTEKHAEFVKYLQQALITGQDGPVLTRLVVRNLNVFLNYDSNYRSPLNVAKNIQTMLVKATNPSVKCTYITALGELCMFKDRSLQLASILVELVGLFLKLLKSVEVPVRVASIDALRCIVEGGGQSTAFVHQDIIKGIRPAFIDKVADVKIAGYEAMLSVAAVTNNFAYLDGQNGGVNLSIKNMEDPSPAVRSAASKCLGKHLSLALLAPPPKPGALTPSKKPITTWTIQNTTALLCNTFLRSSKREGRASAAQSLVVFLNNLTPKVMEKNLEFLLGSTLTLLNTNKNVEDVNQWIECVKYILNQGITEVIGETGHQVMIRGLAQLVSKKSTQDNESMTLAILYQINKLIIVLGVNSVRDSLSRDILPQLMQHNSDHVKYTTGITWKCLGSALPNHLAQFITECLAKCTSEHAVSTVAKPDVIKSHLSSLQAVGLSTACLISSIPDAPQGIPNTVLDVAFQTATNFLRSDSHKANVREVVTQIGWSLLTSLMSLGSTFTEARISDLFQIWNKYLVTDVVSLFVEGSTDDVEINPKAGEKEVRALTSSKEDALVSLHAFIRNAKSILSSRVIKQINTLINGLLNNLTSLPDVKYTAATIQSINHLKYHLVLCFSALPPSSYSSSFVHLLRLLAAQVVEGSTVDMRLVLHQKGGDAMLGPWPRGTAAVQSELMHPTVCNHFILSHLWTGEITSLADHKPVDLNIRLTNVCVILFGQLFCLQSEKNRTQLISHFVNCTKSNTSPAVKSTMHTNILGAILYSLREVMKRKESLGNSKLETILFDFLTLFVGDSAVDTRRAACESLGVLARVQGDAMTDQIVKWNQEALKKTKDPNWMMGCAFLQGSINRYVGGMRCGPHLRASVALLHNIIRDVVLHPSPHSSSIDQWALHSLALTAESAGAAFDPFVNSTLGLLTLLIVRSPSPSQAGQPSVWSLDVQELQAIAEVSNAILHAMGPELTSNHLVLRKSKAIIEQLRVHEDGAVQCGALDFQQSLILFASHTLDVPWLVDYLLKQFLSPKAKTRRASLSCFRQLSQLELKTLYKSAGNDLEERLFIMFDGERDEKCRSEIQLIITSLLDGLVRLCPTRWIQLCKKMVCTSSASSLVEEKDTEEAKAEKDEVVEVTEGAAESGEGANQSLTNRTEDNRDASVFMPRWHTKIFSMQCVNRIFDVLKGDERQFDMFKADEQKQLNGDKGDFLIYNVADLVSMGFISATSDADTIRPYGVQLLKLLVDTMGETIDPDYAGHPILEQYQAQFVSALRPAFAAEAPPTVTQSACGLLQSYLRSPIIRDNRMASKILNLIANPVENLKELSYKAYNEDSATMVQLSILGTLGELYNDTNHSETQKEKFLPSLIPLLPKIKSLWLGALRDYAVLTTQSKASQKVYQAAFFTYPSSDVVLNSFKTAYLPILQSTTSLLSTPFWSRSEEDSEDEIAFYVLLGIAVNALAGTFEAGKAVVALRSMQQLLSGPHLKRADLLPYDLCKEIVNLIRSLVEAKDLTLQTECFRLIQALIHNLDKSYFSQGAGVEILQELLNNALSTARYYIPDLHSNSSEVTVISTTGDIVSVIEMLTSVIVQGTCRLPPTLREEYTPITLYSLVRLSLLRGDTTTNQSLLRVARNGFRDMSLVAREEPGVRKWMNVCFGSLTEGMRENITGERVELLLNLLQDLPMDEDAEEIHLRCCHTLREALKGDVTLQATVLVNLRNFVTSTSAKPDSLECRTSVKYLGYLVPDMVLLLWRRRRDTSEITTEDMSVANECIRLLITAQTLSKDTPELLGLVIQTLVGLLEPMNTSDQLHTVGLQVLLKLATSAPEFKNQVAQLSEGERGRLETSVKLSVQQSQEAAAKAASTAVKTATPLKMDFSKYK
ncbi:HEAT repeat containing 5B [Planoprotostelium fungivorum]|uniref:HEAT repeat containing 5B n=1 Tax=Planoprotostelium fungivorum TaxID=1890364 RepID=A0A2P6NHA9_9EUKA|nr:HEAT repeat containing 5B [Planoprotostelium fungivorum]